MKNMIKLVVLLPLMTIALSGTVVADTKADRAKVRKVMNQVLDSFIRLVPYMNSEMKFKDPKNKKRIMSHVVNLKQSFKNNKHLKTFYMAGFRPSFDTVLSHMEKTVTSFEAGNVLFARSRLNSTASLCISCHSQLKTKGKGFYGSITKIDKGSFKSSLEYADYLFLIRNYKKSVRYYERAIEENIKKDKELTKENKILTGGGGYLDRSTNRALKRILTVYTKVFYDPDMALDFVNKYKNKKGLSKSIRNDLKSWEQQLKPWLQVNPKFKINNEDTFRSYIKTRLHDKSGNEKISPDGSEDITMLVSSGFLFKYINHGPEYELIPELYYWLAKIEKNLDFNFFYSLSDVYLKECIMKYSDLPIAQKCYKQYEEDVTNDFTGSGGTDIPKDIKDELAMLKKKIKVKKKK